MYLLTAFFGILSEMYRTRLNEIYIQSSVGFSRYPSMNKNHKNGTRQQSKKTRSTNRKKSK
jgi:hypothetical protein